MGARFTLKLPDLVRGTPRWLAVYLCCCALAALLPVVRHIPPVSPAVLVYATQDSLLPLVFSPFLVVSPSAFASRIVQIGCVYVHALQSARGHRLPDTVTAGGLMKTYLSLLVVRSVLGFVLTRSVGWQYPALLAPYALYEPIFGLGPLLVGTVLYGPSLSNNSTTAPSDSGGRRSMYGIILRVALVGLWAMLDGLPWTYVSAVVISSIVRLWESFDLPGFMSSVYTHVPIDDSDLPLPSPHPRGYAKRSSSPSPHSSKARLGLICVSTMASTWLLGSLPSTLNRRSVQRFLWEGGTGDASAGKADLHVVMLTFPRERDLDSDFMVDNIKSYLDAFSASGAASSLEVTMTVYGHLGLRDHVHPAFDRAKAFFAVTTPSQLAGLHLDFRMHPFNDEPPSHYAHLADALRYAYVSGHEWTVVVEDDFVLCGTWGMDGILRVVQELGSTLVTADEDERSVPFSGVILQDDWRGSGQKPARWRGAFVGTGGRYVRYLWAIYTVA